MKMISLDLTFTVPNKKEALKEWNPEIDVFIYAGGISPGLSDLLSQVILSKRKGRKVLFFLNTPGGVASEAYKLARLLQRYYENFTMGVTAACKSAGTLMALGANTVAMGPRGELGPLDVQVVRPDEVLHRSSGLTLSQSLESLKEEAFKTWEYIFLEIKRRSGGSMTTRTASDVACQLTSSICSSISQGIDPYHLGDMKRAVDIAYHYGVRLGATPEAVRHLIENYPEHGFVIDMAEAKNIFNDVRELTAFENGLVNAIADASIQEFDLDVTKDYPHSDDYFIHLNPQIEEETHENRSSNHGKTVTAKPDSTNGQAKKAGNRKAARSPSPDTDGTPEDGVTLMD